MASIGSYAFYWNHYFSQDHDPSKVLGQDNILRYVPRMDITLRVSNDDSLLDVFSAIAAAESCNGFLSISISNQWPETKEFLTVLKGLHEDIHVESDEEFCQKIHEGSVTRVRSFKALGDPIATACANAGINLIAAPIIANGRIELLHFLREISISSDYHRYGYLGEREVIPAKEQQGCCQKGCGCSCS
jgi:RHH-type proline utilization regulon transcriptional repressor/proline dehydrogenase/delta 1-pyrroline-5-carboxylate dehydrogenase